MSNQAIRNSDSSYYVEDLGADYQNDSLLRWDDKGHVVDNSLAFVDDAGELTVPTISTGALSVSGTVEADILCAQVEVKTDLINEKTPGAGVTIDSVLVKDNVVTANRLNATTEVRTNSIINNGGGSVNVEGVLDVDKAGQNHICKIGTETNKNTTMHLQCKRDILIFYESDTDGATPNDDVFIISTRDANKSAVCMRLDTNNDFCLGTSSETGSGINGDIIFKTGGTFSATPTGTPPIGSGATTGLTIDGATAKTTSNVGLNIGSNHATEISPTKVNVRGTNASQTAGPHVSYYTDSDDRPLLQVLPYTHDNINISFDAYLNLGGGWTSSHPQSYQIYKSSSVFCIRRGTTAGAGNLVAWQPTFEIGATTCTLHNNDLNIPNGGLKVQSGTGILDYIQNKSTVSYFLIASAGSWATLGNIDFYYSRMGPHIFIGSAVGTNGAITSGSFLTSGATRILPVGYRPTIDTDFSIFVWDNGTYVSGMLTITLNGEIRIYANPSGGGFTTSAGFKPFNVNFTI